MNKYKWFFLIILLLAVFLRTYLLVDYPTGFHIDEATMGWNSYSLFQTGRDETGQRWPLYSRSFGLDRAIGNFIITGISISVFGLNEWAVRFPFALFGILTIVVAYFFVQELFHNQKLSLLVMILLTLSPWHLNITRASSEASVSLFLILLGQWLFVKSWLTNQKLWLLVSGIAFILSLFFYHAAPIFALLSILAILCFISVRQRKIRIPLMLAGIITCTIIGAFLFLGKGGVNRFNQVGFHTQPEIFAEQQKMFFEEGPDNIFTARLFHNKIFISGRALLRNYFTYISFPFLFLDGGKPLRYTPPMMGLIYLIELPLLVFGLYTSGRLKNTARILLLLGLVSPVVAAVTQEATPNVQRAFFMVVYLEIFAAAGLYFISRKLQKIPLIILCSLFAVNIVYYTHQYYVHFPVHDPLYRNDGEKTLALKLKELETQYFKIIVTAHPEPPYHYYLFFNHYDPEKFVDEYSKIKDQSQGFILDQKIYFTRETCPSEKFIEYRKPGYLFIDSSECAFDPSQFSERDDIKRRDGSHLYRLLEWKNASM